MLPWSYPSVPIDDRALALADASQQPSGFQIRKLSCWAHRMRERDTDLEITAKTTAPEIRAWCAKHMTCESSAR